MKLLKLPAPDPEHRPSRSDRPPGWPPESPTPESLAAWLARDARGARVLLHREETAVREALAGAAPDDFVTICRALEGVFLARAHARFNREPDEARRALAEDVGVLVSRALDLDLRAYLALRQAHAELEARASEPKAGRPPNERKALNDVLREAGIRKKDKRDARRLILRAIGRK